MKMFNEQKSLLEAIRQIVGPDGAGYHVSKTYVIKPGRPGTHSYIIVRRKFAAFSITIKELK